MNKQNNMEATHETSRLLSELDQAIDQSSVMRDIVRKYEYIRSIENLTGPSRFTRIMRKEIQILESRLNVVRARHQKQEALLSPV